MLYPTHARSGAPLLWNDLISMGRDIDRLFHRVMSPVASALEGEEHITAWTPPVDVYESGEDFTITFDLPGLSPEDIEVTVTNDRLTVRGNKVVETQEGRGDGTYYCRERNFGRFERTFTLPSTVSAKDMKAEYSNGVLKIVLPKAEEAKPRRIEIERTDAGEAARLSSGERVA